MKSEPKPSRGISSRNCVCFLMLPRELCSFCSRVSAPWVQTAGLTLRTCAAHFRLQKGFTVPQGFFLPFSLSQLPLEYLKPQDPPVPKGQYMTRVSFSSVPPVSKLHHVLYGPGLRFGKQQCSPAQGSSTCLTLTCLALLHQTLL